MYEIIFKTHIQSFLYNYFLISNSLSYTTRKMVIIYENLSTKCGSYI